MILISRSEAFGSMKVSAFGNKFTLSSSGGGEGQMGIMPKFQTPA
jgi:hypothetical protein